MTKQSCVFLGAGGHARVLLDAINLANGPSVHALLDNNASLWGTEVDGIPVIGGDDRLDGILNDGIKAFVVAVGMITPSPARQTLFETALSREVTPLTICHPTATISKTAILEHGCQILAGSVVNAGAIIGKNAIVNTGAIVEHGCNVGDHAHIATGACLGGDVVIGAGAHIGIGATICQGVRIGDRALVAAGATVINNVNPADTVAGVPAHSLNHNTDK
jgi:sugar O-acyltransferase (sialic acid O-acetyltransferase NeuD family)